MRTIYRLYYIFRDFSWQMTKKNIAAFAASTAFFLFLSMIPLLMALCAILPYTALTEDNLINAITRFTPDAMNALVVGRHDHCICTRYDLVCLQGDAGADPWTECGERFRGAA